MSFFPDDSLGTPGVAVPAVATQVAGSDGTLLRTLATDTSGRQKVLLYDAAGNAITSTAGALNVNISSGAASFNVIDEATWTAGTSPFVPDGGVFNDSAAALTSGQQGTGRQTPNRARHSNLRRQDGTEIGVAATPLIENLTQLGGTAIDTNSGNKSAGTQRVVLATDQPLQTNVCEQVTTSADVIRRKFDADQHSSTLFAITNAFHTYLTGSPRYFLTSVDIECDLTMTFAGGGSLVVILQDTTDGVLFQWFVYVTNAFVAPGLATSVPRLVTPPGWFYKASTNTSSLQVKTNVTVTNNNFLVNLAYGFTSF